MTTYNELENTLRKVLEQMAAVEEQSWVDRADAMLGEGTMEERKARRDDVVAKIKDEAVSVYMRNRATWQGNNTGTVANNAAEQVRAMVAERVVQSPMGPVATALYK